VISKATGQRYNEYLFRKNSNSIRTETEHVYRLHIINSIAYDTHYMQAYTDCTTGTYDVSILSNYKKLQYDSPEVEYL